jgi:3-oxoacyl-[acyl-carrier protein] reductase
VTGGTRGIGRAIVSALLEKGCAVTFCGRTQASVDEALNEFSHPNVSGTPADVSLNEQVAALFRFADRQMGGLDILVNNAGLGIMQPAGDLSVEDWNLTLATNTSGAFYCARHALDRMRPAGGGFIVNIASLASKNPFAGGAAYNASKFALLGMAEAVIRVSTIMPGSVDTGFSRSGKNRGQDWKIAPEDVADMVVAVLEMPARTMVSRVEMRPSRPSK